MGPVGRPENAGKRAGAVDDRMVEPEPGGIITGARFHRVHKPGPAVHGVRAAQRKLPPEYGARDYRYTVVNGRTVLVDPRTHRIVEIVE